MGLMAKGPYSKGRSFLVPRMPQADQITRGERRECSGEEESCTISIMTAGGTPRLAGLPHRHGSMPGSQPPLRNHSPRIRADPAARGHELGSGSAACSCNRSSGHTSPLRRRERPPPPKTVWPQTSGSAMVYMCAPTLAVQSVPRCLHPDRTVRAQSSLEHSSNFHSPNRRAAAAT